MCHEQTSLDHGPADDEQLINSVQPIRREVPTIKNHCHFRARCGWQFEGQKRIVDNGNLTFSIATCIPASATESCRALSYRCRATCVGPPR